MSDPQGAPPPQSQHVSVKERSERPEVGGQRITGQTVVPISNIINMGQPVRFMLGLPPWNLVLDLVSDQVVSSTNSALQSTQRWMMTATGTNTFQMQNLATLQYLYTPVPQSSPVTPTPVGLTTTPATTTWVFMKHPSGSLLLGLCSASSGQGDCTVGGCIMAQNTGAPCLFTNFPNGQTFSPLASWCLTNCP